MNYCNHCCCHQDINTETINNLINTINVLQTKVEALTPKTIKCAVTFGEKWEYRKSEKDKITYDLGAHLGLSETPNYKIRAQFGFVDSIFGTNITGFDYNEFMKMYYSPMCYITFEFNGVDSIFYKCFTNNRQTIDFSGYGTNILLNGTHSRFCLSCDEKGAWCRYTTQMIGGHPLDTILPGSIYNFTITYI